MKIVVTTGSGRFDQLIEAVDNQLSPEKYQVLCQVGKGGLSSQHHQSVEFIADFKSVWHKAEIIITHGGAGTVFELLEAGKKLVVVPNTFRIDGHQTDLARYIEEHQLAVVCHDLAKLNECVESCVTQQFKPYQKDPFFMAESILQYFEVPTS